MAAALDELAVHRGYPKTITVDNGAALGPVVVTSGDRKSTPKGSNSKSHHLAHRAGDLHVEGMTDQQVFDALRGNPRNFFDVGSRYQVILHGPHTNTTGGHVHIGRYADGAGVSFWHEGITPGSGGKYRRLE